MTKVASQSPQQPPPPPADPAAGQALFNPFGTLGVVTPPRPAPAVEAGGDAVPSLFALALLAAGITVLLRKALQ